MEANEDGFVPDDHRVAFIFGQDDESPEHPSSSSRPTKKRRKLATASSSSASKQAAISSSSSSSSTAPSFSFPRGFHGAESASLAAQRQQQFAASWAGVEARIQTVLRASNRATLDAVAGFVVASGEAEEEEVDEYYYYGAGSIPTGLIVTGPNGASQEMLFSQLAERLGADGRRFVRLRSAEAVGLKATLRKIIRDVTRAGGDGEEEEDDDEGVTGKNKRKYLDYDLEAIHAHIKNHGSKHVTIAFQDSEAFDTGLLSDLITLFSSWRNRISWTLLFGIATSVELFEARLLKSTIQCLRGVQFDAAQMSTILESVFKCAVAHADSPLRLGPGFLHSLIERQRFQVAGIQMFNNSLKYAYMCHFYGNPLSSLLHPETELQPEHCEAIRNLPSFRAYVEDAVEAGQSKHAKSLLEDDKYLSQRRTMVFQETLRWKDTLLRTVALLMASELSQDDFITTYIDALANGVELHPEESKGLDKIRRMSADELSSLLQRLVDAVTNGNVEIGVKGWANEGKAFLDTLSDMADRLASLQAEAQLKGQPLRSQYNAQSRALRTTIVAQKVQLSRDESRLTTEDKALTELIDKLLDALVNTISCKPAKDILLHELWMYESKSPHKDVFIPRPGAIFDRALSRPHDYLACACCTKVVEGGNAATLPATSIMYHLYQETGALINVADMWSAFCALVGKQDSEQDINDADGYDERTALVLFYRGLAELKAMGFVKATRRRTDHVAKTKWLL